ncbi:hypothetical protein IEQ34_010024 [Dendrobium chrysotoxum]|uniref:Translation initiation factor eIF2B subunit gamma n=1 Tax=Dendrobium chrysotoxum TaxID=161865 RepID=A0AAV7GL07_DENCH|nr:hypothetical protein IEQ34_010024 [Dendrobium chrysotoxum]
MDFQVVVMAGGYSKNLAPLVSEAHFLHLLVFVSQSFRFRFPSSLTRTRLSLAMQEMPKPLLPVANRPVLSYVLELLEASNLKDLIVVVEGEDVALRVGGWISGAYVDRLHVEVAAVPEEVGTAGALRAVAHHLTAKDILVVSGDLVSDVPPGAVAATHRRLDAAVTALLCITPVSGSSESVSSVGKDKGRKLPRANIVGLDHTRQYLLHVAAGAEVGKDIKIQKSILQANGQMEIRADLMDAHMYAFQRTILQEVLDQKEMFHSIKHDVFPYLVRTQLRSEILDKGAPKNGLNGADYTLNGSDLASENLTNRTHKCCAYIANKSKYCSRLNSVQAFCDINRDVVGEAGHLSGYSFSAQNNIVHPSAELGSKTTVGPQCMLDEGSKLGDKCSVKRSVIGRHCRIGSNVKIFNSVVMNHVTIEDGCFIQGSVICNNAQLQERVVLKDCQVGAGYVLTVGSEYKSEPLSKK